MKCRTLAIVMIAAALAVPAVLADGAEATDPQYTVTLLDYDGVTVLDTLLMVGHNRTIENAHPYAYNYRPYWYDRSTGYEWPIDKVVDRDIILIASETQPTQEPVETPTDYTPLVGGGALLVLAGGMFAGVRRMNKA